MRWFFIFLGVLLMSSLVNAGTYSDCNVYGNCNSGSSIVIAGNSSGNGTVGPQGPQGIPGINGTNGKDGTNGTNGGTGPQGNPGTNGINGTNGVDGINGTNAYNITTYINTSEVDPIFTLWNSTFLYDHNQSSPFYSWVAGFVYNYNQSSPYDRYNYNMTLPAMTYEYNQTNLGTYNYNQTYTGGTYNASYQLWAYNQTSPLMLYFYNQTAPAMLYEYNQSSIYSYNHTADVSTQYGKWFYNMSSPFYTWNAGFLYNYNQTLPLMTYNYNQTAPAMTYEYNETTICQAYTNIKTVTNGITIAGENITSGLIGLDHVTNVTCSGSTVIQNYTSSGVQCITPTATGTFTQMNVTTADKTTNNFTAWSTQAGQDVITIPISANKNANIECVLWSNSSLASIGVQYNITFTGAGTPTKHTWDIEEFTAVTPTRTTYYAQGLAGTLSYAVLPTSSAGGYFPTYLHGLVQNGASATTFKLRMKAEVTGGTVATLQGSWCSSIEG